MARYEVSIPRNACSNRARAVRKARLVAAFERVGVEGRPSERVQRAVPWIGRATAYRVTFPSAKRELPRSATQRHLEDLAQHPDDRADHDRDEHDDDEQRRGDESG